MDNKFIVEGNELIAVFMGSEYKNDPYKAKKEDKFLTDFWHWTKPKDGYPKCAVTGIEWSTAIMIGNFKYHSSWDWLMPVQGNVIRALRNLEKSVKKSRKGYDNKMATLKHMNDCESSINCCIWGGRIDEAFYGIVETIKLLNKNFK